MGAAAPGAVPNDRGPAALRVALPDGPLESLRCARGIAKAALRARSSFRIWPPKHDAPTGITTGALSPEPSTDPSTSAAGRLPGRHHRSEDRAAPDGLPGDPQADRDDDRGRERRRPSDEALERDRRRPGHPSTGIDEAEAD